MPGRIPGNTARSDPQRLQQAVGVAALPLGVEDVVGQSRVAALPFCVTGPQIKRRQITGEYVRGRPALYHQAIAVNVAPDNRIYLVLPYPLTAQFRRAPSERFTGELRFDEGSAVNAHYRVYMAVVGSVRGHVDHGVW